MATRNEQWAKRLFDKRPPAPSNTGMSQVLREALRQRQERTSQAVEQITKRRKV